MAKKLAGMFETVESFKKLGMPGLSRRNSMYNTAEPKAPTTTVTMEPVIEEKNDNKDEEELMSSHKSAENDEYMMDGFKNQEYLFGYKEL